MSDSVLQPPVPLSQSLLWAWQRAYYDAAGQRAWSDGVVPWRITSCPLTAKSLAGVVEAVAASSGAQVNVLELGGGTGRLAFHLSRELLQREVDFRYLLTDVTRTNVDAWRKHPQLKPLVAQRVLDFAVHDAGSTGVPVGVESGAPLDVAAPTVVLGTYLFDTLPHDAWRKRDGALEQVLVGLRGPAGDVPPLDDVEWTLSHAAPAEVPPFLRGYAASLPDTDFLLPTGALACLAALERLTRGPVLTLFADKGSVDTPSPWFTGKLPLAKHGCVSANVNFHALRAWAGWRTWLEPAEPDGNFGLYGVGTRLPAAVRDAVREAWHGAPADAPALKHLRAVNAVLASDEVPDPLVALQLLAASHFDPDVFLRLSDGLRTRIGDLPREAAPALVSALDAVWANAFDVGEANDVAFEAATVLHRGGLLADAERHYETSLLRRGRHPTTLFNLALCALDKGEAARGRLLLEEVRARAPGHEKATSLLARLPRPPTDGTGQPPAL